jgi:hypothetical protein
MAAALVVAALAPAPSWAMRAVAERNAFWLLNYGNATAGPPRWLSIWLDKNLTSSLARRVDYTGTSNDAERIGRALATIKPYFLTQDEVMHSPTLAPTSVAGLTWCNHINVVAGEVISRHFSRVEMIATYDEETRGGHSFGRAWSDEFKGWLYFDAWPDEVSVFRPAGNGKVRFLYQSTPLPGPVTPRTPAMLRIYGKASQAYPIFRLHSSFAAQVIEDAYNIADHGTRQVPGADQKMAKEREIIGSGQYGGPPRLNRAAAGEYALARVAHLQGDIRQARDHYLASARLERSPNSFRLAALAFSDRLKSPIVAESRHVRRADMRTQ